MTDNDSSPEELICPKCGQKVEIIFVKKMSASGWAVFLICITAAIVSCSLTDKIGIKAIALSIFLLLSSLIGLGIRSTEKKCKNCNTEFA